MLHDAIADGHEARRAATDARILVEQMQQDAGKCVPEPRINSMCTAKHSTDMSSNSNRHRGLSPWDAYRKSKVTGITVSTLETQKKMRTSNSPVKLPTVWQFNLSTRGLSDVPCRLVLRQIPRVIWSYTNQRVEAMSGQGSVSQAVIGTFSLGVVYDSSSFQVVLRDANVYVDAVVL